MSLTISVFVLSVFAFQILSTSVNADVDNIVTNARPSVKTTNTELSNPADVKCAKDGYKVQAILVNGIPTDSVCINPSNGRRCNAWAYFRGKCSLSNQQHNPRNKR